MTSWPGMDELERNEVDAHNAVAKPPTTTSKTIDFFRRPRPGKPGRPRPPARPVAAAHTGYEPYRDPDQVHSLRIVAECTFL